MEKLQRTAERRDYANSHLKRISWAAIFAGTVIAIATMTVLGSLGVAVNAMGFDGASKISAGGLGVGAAIWWIVSGMIALFLGGMAAGRLAGLSRRWEGPLHGVIAWALVTLVAFASTATLIAQMAPGHHGSWDRRSARPGAMGKARDMSSMHGRQMMMMGWHNTDLPEAVWRDVRREALALLRRSAQMKTLKAAGGEGETTMDTLILATDEIDAALTKLYRSAKTGAAAGEVPVVDVLIARTELSRQEAQERASRWSTLLADAWTAAGSEQSMMDEWRPPEKEMTKKRERATARVSRFSVSGAAWFSVIYLLLSAVAGGFGGLLGAPNHRARLAQSTPEPSTTGED